MYKKSLGHGVYKKKKKKKRLERVIERRRTPLIFPKTLYTRVYSCNTRAPSYT